MSRTRYQRIRAAYLEILRMDEPAREGALDALDAELRSEVRTMLAGAATQGILDREPFVEPDPLPGSIGPYRVIGRIGRGGMGDVFLAEQEGELHRQVAVKRIRNGSRFLERFETERRVLAQLSHPNIAVVYDAGQDGDHSWLAMQFIDGQPVDRWARRDHPTLQEKVAVVRQICAGVNHAHQRGVLHRDLKPSNLLVETVDGRPTIRIIDFGIAKIMGTLEGIEVGRTMAGQFLGTPEYMSPEQTELQPGLVDTRSDIYAIGVVLFELISGHLPHPTDQLAGMGLTELRQILLHEDPPPPSRFAPGLNRELDWICGRTLARDPERRYQSAQDLADDLERWLEGRPVVAAPPGTTYRARKFAQRHKLALSAGAAILTLLVGGLLTTSLALLRARQAEALARAESQRSRQTSEFLLDLFDDADPTLGGARDEIAEWILRRGRHALDELEDPALRRTFTPTMGRLYTTLGLYQEAGPLLNEALDSVAASEGPLALGRARYQLALNDYNLGRYGRADSLLQLAGAAALDAEDGSPRQELLADISSWRSSVAIKAGEPDRALDFLDTSIGRLESLGTGYWFRVADNLQSRSVALRMLERFEEALAASDRGLALMEKNGASNRPAFAAGLHSRANVLSDLDRHEEALADFRRSREIWIASFGELHPFVGSSYSSQSVAHYYLGQYEEMEDLASKALAIQEQLTSRDHPSLAQHLINRSVARLSMERYEGVEEDLLRALGIYRQTHGETHHRIADVLDNLAFLYQQLDRQADALDTYRRCAEMRMKVLGPTSRRTLLSRLKYAEALAEGRHREEALTIAADILPVLEEVRGPDHDHSRRARVLLGNND